MTCIIRPDNPRVRSKVKKRKVEEDGGSSEEQAPATGSLAGGHTFVEESEKMEDGTEYWRCSCGKIYLGRDTLLKHVKEVRGEVTGGKGEVDGRGNWVNCGICGVNFKRRFELNRHMKVKHGLESKVGTGRGLEVAGNEVDGGGDRIIVRRNESVEDFGGVHEQEGLVATLEDGTEQWRCSCGRLYGSKEAMCRHVKEKNLDPSKWIGCPHCTKSFKRRSELTRHVNGVHREKIVGGGGGKECEYCGEGGFAGVGELKRHQKNECLNVLETSQEDALEEMEGVEEQVENREEAEETMLSLSLVV